MATDRQRLERRAVTRPAVEPPRVGLVAGWGRFPLQVAEALRRQGYAVHAVGLAGHVDPRLAHHCARLQMAGLARLGRQIRFFRRQGIRRVIWAGKVHKILLFQPGFLRQHLPDWTTLRTYFPHFVAGRKNRNDDALLRAAVQAFARRGIRVTPAAELVPELLVRHGHLCGPKLTTGQLRDIRYGWELAKEMGRLDVGQSVAVKGRAVLAVEAVEGTDECIRRAGLLCPAGGFVLVKVAKPQQDARFDVPTIGVGTIQSLLQAGGKVLAVEAERTIVVDEPELVRFAQRHGVTVAALHDGELSAAEPKPA